MLKGSMEAMFDDSLERFAGNRNARLISLALPILGKNTSRVVHPNGGVEMGWSKS